MKMKQNGPFQMKFNYEHFRLNQQPINITRGDFRLNGIIF